MKYKPKTSLELNLHHIKKTLSKIESKEMTVKEGALNKRFEKLSEQSKVWYEELYPKYINVVKNLNK